MDYLTLKTIHVSSVIASYTLFVVRGVWMIRMPDMLSRRWVRIAPHVIDTLLLASAIAMAVMIRQYPFVAGWLTAKVTALIVYIGLGTIALKRGRSKRTRVIAWLAAQAVFAYIVAVAVTHDPAPWTALR
jgi:uncharacterized membrane protein SirB2